MGLFAVSPILSGRGSYKIMRLQETKLSGRNIDEWSYREPETGRYLKEKGGETNESRISLFSAVVLDFVQLHMH